MKIEPPRHNPDYADYGLECEEAIDIAARELVDQAVQAGWSPRAVYVALQSVASNQAMAYEADPEPADDRV